MQLEYEDLESLTLDELEFNIRHSQRIRIGDLRVLDLVFDADGLVSQGHGIYLFFGPDGRCLYIGRALAPSLLERVPWHFSISPYSWGNQLVKNLAWKKGWGDERLVECARLAREFTLLLIRVACENSETERQRIRGLERLLIKLLDPELNRRKPKLTLPERSTTVAAALKAIG